ncbi:hypothetical protein BDZ91DRAFT_735119 [Kalaharituber pfeilii]|nr:hypothetical protein BDZ91DRAFT_735119 [Kalaharituber pfeilii]
MILASLWKLKSGKDGCPMPGSTLSIRWDGDSTLLAHGSGPEGSLQNWLAAPSPPPPSDTLGLNPITNIDTVLVQPDTEVRTITAQSSEELSTEKTPTPRKSRNPVPRATHLPQPHTAQGTKAQKPPPPTHPAPQPQPPHRTHPGSPPPGARSKETTRRQPHPPEPLQQPIPPQSSASWCTVYP